MGPVHPPSLREDGGEGCWLWLSRVYAPVAVHFTLRRDGLKAFCNELQLGGSIVENIAVGLHGRHILFTSVAATAVCIWGCCAEWTELNRK